MRCCRLAFVSSGRSCIFALDAVNDLESLSLLRQALDVLLALETGLDLSNHVVQADQDALLLGVTISQTHLLNLDIASGDFVISEENGEWYAVGLGCLELRRHLGLNLVEKLGL